MGIVSLEEIRVLHVDDDPAFATLTKRRLEEDGRFVVRTETRARDALECLARGEFDCVVAGYDTRGADGLELLEAVRERDPTLPFILFTGQGSEEVASEAIAAGVTGYLPKGDGREQYTSLANRIETAVSEANTEGELAEFREAVIESANVWINVLDTEGNVVIWNEAAERISGYLTEEVTGHARVWEWLYPDPDYRAGILEHVGAILEGEMEVEEFETTIRRKDGEQRTVSWHSRRVETGEGETIGSVAIGRDITEESRRIREIERKTTALERQNERLEKFTSIVSHDLRNPLNVAQLRLDLARDHPESEHPGDEHLDQAADALDRIQVLIDDLLALAREGDDAYEQEPVALAEVVEDCWRTVATANATLDLRAGSVIRADRSRLRQLLENLIRNAVEHGSTSRADADASADAVEHGSTSPDSRAREAVEHGVTSADSRAREEVTVTVGELPGGFYVADDGSGVPPEERERVFENGYTTTPGGVGFGLSIVEEIVEAHGWDVRVTDGTTGGARFEVTGVEAAE